MAVKPIPEGYHSVTPYMVANDAQKLIEFAKRAFDAKVVEEMRRALRDLKNASEPGSN